MRSRALQSSPSPCIIYYKTQPDYMTSAQTRPANPPSTVRASSHLPMQSTAISHNRPHLRRGPSRKEQVVALPLVGLPNL